MTILNGEVPAHGDRKFAPAGDRFAQRGEDGLPARIAPRIGGRGRKSVGLGFCGTRRGRLKRGQRSMLGLGERGHQSQLLPDRLTESVLAERAQALCALQDDARAIRQSDPRNRTMGERLNPGGVENSLHALSRGAKPYDA